jgi:hypothetical protein
VLQLYRSYLTWREELPEHLADPDVGEPLAHSFSLQYVSSIMLNQRTS